MRPTDRPTGGAGLPAMDTTLIAGKPAPTRPLSAFTATPKE